MILSIKRECRVKLTGLVALKVYNLFFAMGRRFHIKGSDLKKAVQNNIIMPEQRLKTILHGSKDQYQFYFL